jgi:hypothetical protein
MTPERIREFVFRMDSADVHLLEDSWSELRGLKVQVCPYFLESFPLFRKWQGRVALVFHATSYARESKEAFRLGLLAIQDRSTAVRYRGCGLLAYSLDKGAIEHLSPLLAHKDGRTVEDAAAAIHAIENRNHHFFVDRAHSGSVFWQVNESDSPHIRAKKWWQFWR